MTSWSSSSNNRSPNRTRPNNIEDAVAWALETTPETLAATFVAAGLTDEETRALAARIRCPVLVLHGDSDNIVPPVRGKQLADATGGECRIIAGSGHLPQARVPVLVNLRFATSWR